MQNNNFPWPKPSEHVLILGRNGSGKTQGGVWLASAAPFHDRPLIFIDHKGDELINSIGAEHLSIHSAPPTLPGVYIVKPKPRVEDEALDKFLWQVHANERTCLFFDEGYVVAKIDALDTILMQGRSKEIQCTILAQRPAWLSRYAFSEASHMIAYHLHDRRDQKTVREFFNDYQEDALPDYHAQWYDVKKNKNYILQPVPSADNIRSIFKSRLEEIRAEKQQKKSKWFF